jgi:hypothetical protein
MKKPTPVLLFWVLIPFLILPQLVSAQNKAESAYKPLKFDKSANQCERPKAPADLHFENVVLSDANRNGIAEADEKMNLKFDLVNTGKGYGCWVALSLKEIRNTGSGLPLPRGEALSELLPGERKQISWEFTGSMQQSDRKITLALCGSEKNGFDPDTFFIRNLEVRSFQPPRVEIADYKFSSQTGVMQAGVTITLRAAVQNMGTGPAENIRVAIKLPESNIFLSSEFPYANIPELLPGESKMIDFDFTPNKRYTEKTLPCTLSISEKFEKYGSERAISVAMNERIATPLSMDVVAKEIKREGMVKATLNSEVDKNIPEAKSKNSDAVAVVIGNRNYQKTKTVDFALNDAASIRNYLVKAMGFQDANILYFQDATLSDMNTIFGKERSKGRLHDRIKPGQSDVFIFYSGHGAPDLGEGGDSKGYLVPVDCDPNYVAQGGYALETFYGNLDMLPVKSLSVVLDACFSGEEIIQKASPLMIKTKMPAIRKATVLASSRETQVSNWYADQEHGLFTYYFLKSIKENERCDANKDSKLSFQEIYDYISSPSEGIPYQSKILFSAAREQNPVLMGTDKDRVLVNLGR